MIVLQVEDRHSHHLVALHLILFAVVAVEVGVGLPPVRKQRLVIVKHPKQHQVEALVEQEQPLVEVTPPGVALPSVEAILL